jgi:hypothetical protein
MRKNILALIIAVVFSFVLVLVGQRISYSLCFGEDQSGAAYKSDLITFFLIQSFVVFPVSAMITGAFVGWFTQKSAWWLAGISLLPLLIYSLMVNSWERAEVFLSIIYLALSLASAFGVSWWKDRRRVLA